MRQEGVNTSREPEQQEKRWGIFIKQWIAASNRGECLIIGDTNLDTLKWDNPEYGQENMIKILKEEIITRNFHQMIQGPTRFWPGARPSLIDQCWSNNAVKLSNIGNVTRGTADHNMIRVNYRLKGNISSRLETKGRDRRKFCEKEFKRRMALQDWSEVFEETDVNIATFKFETKFIAVLDQLAPMKKFQSRARRSDWISGETKRLIGIRDETRNRAVETSNHEEWTEYRSLRNLINKRVKNDRNENLKKHFSRLHESKDSKGLFNLARKKMGWKQPGAPEVFVINGIKTTNPKTMANIQINAFHDKVLKLIQQLPPQSKDPLSHLLTAMQRWGKSDSIPELSLKPVTVCQVIKVIKDLNSSHAFGHEGIDSSSLKLVAESVAAPIASIINKSILEKKFPSRWKFGRLIPLYKGGKKDHLVPESYRPISMLSTISKVTEKVDSASTSLTHGCKWIMAWKLALL